MVIDENSEAAMEQQQSAGDWLAKAHVCAALQGLGSAEQREKALRGLAAYKELFAEAEWKPILQQLEKVAQEDRMRLPNGLQLEPVTPAGRPLPTSSSSAPNVLVVGQRSRASPLPRLNTASADRFFARNPSPRTPRPRWDVISSGPVTPLSPTPTGNAFAGGGFWEKLTPQPQTALPQTPITAAASEPWSPIVPMDPEAKAAYDEVKHDVDSMATRICASRLSIHSNLSDKGLIHPSMVKPKDELHGAEVTLQSRQIKLRTQVDTELPKKIQRLAHDEAAVFRQYSIKDALELLHIDTWLQVDEKTLEMTTILDAQLELLRMSRNRRKSKELKLSDQALQLAWAVKILEDTERMITIKGDSSSISSDEDNGYDYSNFLRSIKREVRSVSDLASIEEEKAIGDISPLRSSATTATSSNITRSRNASLSTRMSASPSKPYSHALRLREASIPSGECSLKRSTNVTGKRKNFSISTALAGKEDISAPPISPEDKGFRHRGPSFTDLTNWAQELKKMEDIKMETRSDTESFSSSQRHVHPALRSPQHNHSRHSSTSSGDSWKCEGAARHERRVSASNSKTQTPNNSPPTHRLEVPQTPTTPSRRSPSRSKSFYSRDQLTGPIPLPPTISTSYNRQGSTSRERLSSKSMLQLRVSSPPEVPPPALPSSSPPQQYLRGASTSPLHKMVRHQQHTRTKSSLSGSRDEDAWTEELKRMESREKIRQLGERGTFGQMASRRVSGTSLDEGGFGDDAEDEDEEEVGIAR